MWKPDSRLVLKLCAAKNFLVELNKSALLSGRKLMKQLDFAKKWESTSQGEDPYVSTQDRHLFA